MAYSLSPWLKPRFFITGTNRPLAGGLMYTYKAGTTDNATTYSDDSGTPNTNPIQLDSDGQCDLFLDDAVSYRIILKNSAGVTQFDKDRIASIGSTQVQAFNSVAALRLKTGTAQANSAQTLGYYRAGDGGCNSFYWDSTSVLSDNGGTIIKPTSVSGAGRWISTATLLNPNMFGAVGDGTTDDLSAINAMFNYFGNNTYSIEFIANKVYYVSAQILVSLSGSNDGGKLIRGNGAIIKLSDSVRNSSVFKISAAANSSIKNIVVENLTVQTAALSGGVVYDPASIANGATLTTTMTVPGALVGDSCTVNFNSDLLGCTISGSVTSANTVTVTFTNTTGSAQNIASGTIYARVANGSVHGFVLESIGSLGYLYKFTLSGIRVIGTSGNGIYINGTVFEGSINDCFVDKGSTALNGYGLCINAPASNLNPSSIDVNSFQCRGGLHGIFITGTPNVVENINIFGGTTLFSGNEGINWLNCKGIISGVHVETPNRLSLVSASNTYGIKTSGGSAVIMGNYVIDTNQRTATAIFAFSSSSKVTLINNNNVTIEKLYKVQTSGNGGILVIGQDYDATLVDEVFASNVSYLTDRLTAQSIVNKTGFYASNASITPDFQKGCVVNLQDLATNTTINAPTNFTAVNGAELTISIKQNSAGGWTVAFDAIYARTGTAVSTTAFAITVIKFMYIQSKWREVSLTTTF